MVTTRRGTGTDPLATSTPRSSTKKTIGKRELEALGTDDTPTVNKRRRRSIGVKKTPAKEKDEQASQEAGEKKGVIRDSVAVVIPDRTKDWESSPAQEKEEPRSARRGRWRVVITKQNTTEPSTAEPAAEGTVSEDPATTQETEFYTPGTHIASSVYATPADTLDGAASPTPKPTKMAAPKSAQSSQRRKSGKRSQGSNDVTVKSKFPDEIPSSTWESEQAPVDTQDSVPTPTPATKNTQIRFDSEDPIPAPEPVAPEAIDSEPAQDHAEDDASDSDEAPEMVTTATAASKVKATEEDAARAHKAQQEKEELKKQQRAARIAEEQAAKRKREETKAKKLAKRQAREQKHQQRDDSATRERLDVDMHKLPALLPDSILEAAGDRRPPTPPPTRPGKSAEEMHKEKLNRHIKFLEQSEKPVKDVKKGSVNVSVLSKQNALLAPKVNKSTKNIREHWLKGRQQDKKAKKGSGKVPFKKMERRPVGGGFLRGGDE
ncbi:hypothetical protein CC80DRAFT_488407 [Byssothecium circinans]|uniref:Uncharacterized protein n=1 Tax=Byssothecium circinans TaxID=147558 RepID=A0A6A5UBA6_9PLEO|nr:hypothetical protein CC80DRAFT_488407 [Byssothecium circinans]